MKTKKKFDAVDMMRKLRDNLSKELTGKKYEEQKKYLSKKLDKVKYHSISDRKMSRKNILYTK